MAGAWRHATSISSKLKPILLRMLPPALQDFYMNLPSRPQDVPPLNFPQVPNHLPQLLQLGVSPDRANLLYSLFVNAVRKVDQTLCESYYADTPKLLGNSAPLSTGSRSAYVQAIQDLILSIRSQTIARLWSALLSQTQAIVNEARSIQAAPEINTILPSTGSTSKRKRQGRPSPFNPEQTFALNALLDRDDHFSHEDKEFIAQQLNLTRDQVNRWFCNARARKKSGCRPPPRSSSPASVRTVSSDLTSTELYLKDQGTATLEATCSTPRLDDTSPGTTCPTPALTDSTSGFNDPRHRSTTSALETHSLDVYLNYSACLEPKQGPSEPTHNLTPQQDRIASWSENVNTIFPLLPSSSFAEPQGAVTSDAPHYTEPHVTSFNDPLFDPLSFTSIQPLPPFHSPASESSPFNDLFPNFDLSNW